jgi:hypothetical protein
MAEDCFLKIRIAATHAASPGRGAPSPHRAAAARPRSPHHLRHAVGLRRPRAAAHAEPTPSLARQFLESSLQMRTLPVYELRPTSCDRHPAIRSPAPGAPALTAQRLLDAFAGPPPAAAAPPAPIADQAVELPPAPGDLGLPVIGGGPGGGLPPTVTLPVAPTAGGVPPVVLAPPVVLPPVLVPPVVVPPDTPPIVTPPIIILPPIVPPPITPPEGPPITPPGGPGGPPAGGVPEPATWAMLALGFFALGGALRSRQAAARGLARQGRETSR